MEKAIIFVEGQIGQPALAAQTQRPFAGVAEPEEFLLQSAFNMLFAGVIPPSIFLFEMKEGWKAALKNFARHQSFGMRSDLMLLLDYADRDVRTPHFSSSEEKKRVQLAPQVKEYEEKGDIPPLANNFSESFDRIFFMVQKMEAWILSQPEVIETCFGIHKLDIKNNFEAQKGRLIKNPASSTNKPDEVLKQLLRYFKVRRQGRERSLEYRKVQHASQMLRQLDIRQLMQDFEDVRMLVEKINQEFPDPLR
jgi:hypothetical protein